ncbi:MAG: LysM peptidoglycan-binding domain-containing protein [Deltaproteobacteria bacterium]|nr:LysM peptidoglycan-binding domain-containing protein [Deltaproteobacteria bacterium]NIS77558.1 LysM peptidoglycan-binding domain-containing protein [Deltaproteobacteria bacterium]
MGATFAKRIIAASLALGLAILLNPRWAHSSYCGMGSFLFKEAGISVEHAFSTPASPPESFVSGIAASRGGPAFRGEKGACGFPALTREGDNAPGAEGKIESNMDEEIVAESPEDLYEEEEDIPLPVDLNKRVEYAIRYFQTRARPHFTEWYRRFGRYDMLMRKILRAEGVPGDFVYLAMIESGFSPRAVSRAGAIGIWQFMYWTGKKYGLDINWWDDERRDFERSTRAAARYLKSLYDMFGSWYLAAAAYNVGEGKIDRAIRRYRTNDYWKLVKYRYLPRETKNYVPKMLAALTVVKDPESYGFDNLEMDEPLEFDTVEVPGGIDLRTLADIIGVDYEEVTLLNPGIRRGVVPPNFSSYTIRLPGGSKKHVEENREEISRRGKVKLVLHRIKSKDNIGRIAKKYSADVFRIKEVNGLRSNLIGGRKRLIIPIVGETENEFAASLKPADQKSLKYVVSNLERSARYYYVYRQGNRKIYLVKRGDSLYEISRRFGVPIATLKRLNGLEGNVIRPGQKLTIRVYGKPAEIAQGKSRNLYTYAVKSGKKVYTVKSGNSLYSIARAFGISIAELKKMNGLKSEVIRPGMKLVVGYTG